MQTKTLLLLLVGISLFLIGILAGSYLSEISEFVRNHELAELVGKIAPYAGWLSALCALLLAMNVAHYQSKYGELPLDEKLALIGMTKPNVEQIQLMTDGIEILVGVLSNVVVGIEQARH
jgi:hypothetical protein